LLTGPQHINQNTFALMATGDEQSFKAIFHHYTSRLLPHINNIVKSEVIAEEILQETFLRLWKNKETVGQMDNPTAWLFTVASNLCFKFLRKAANEERAMNELISRMKSHTLSQTDYDQKEKQSALLTAVNQLPAQRQLVFKLSREAGLSHQEIADQLNISPNTVKNQIVKSIHSIRDYMQKAGVLSFFISLNFFF
jgi:RNA polymerase sigma-70 factor (family 1)